MYSPHCRGDGSVGNISNLKAQTAVWNKLTNKRATKIQWRFTKTKARKSVNYDVENSTSGKT